MEPLRIDGIEVHFYRARDGVLTVTIESGDAQDRDTYESSAVPRVRMIVNGFSEVLDEDGEWTPEED